MTLQQGSVRVSAPLTGAPQFVVNGTRSGDGYTVSHQLEGATLLQVITGKGLRQERRFTLDSAGMILTVNVRVTGDGLASAVLSRATYRRD